MEDQWYIWWAWYPVRLVSQSAYAHRSSYLRPWVWRRWVSYRWTWEGGWGNDDRVAWYDLASRTPAWRDWDENMKPSDLREKMEAVWRLDPWHERKVHEDAVAGLIRWTRDRQQPRLWHYALRFYRGLVLPRLEWRLPWR